MGLSSFAFKIVAFGIKLHAFFSLFRGFNFVILVRFHKRVVNCVNLVSQ